MQPHYSQSSRENATPFSGTSPLAYYEEVPPGGNNRDKRVARIASDIAESPSDNIKNNILSS